MTNILIADHHSLCRKGVKQLLKKDHDFKVIGKAKSAQSLYKKLAKHKPDILLLDIDLPELNGINCLRTLKEDYKEMSILIFSSQPAEIYALRTIKCGTSGYISKTSSSRELYHALQLVADGKIYLNDTISRIASSKTYKNKMPAFRTLSTRETEVLNLLSKGRRNKDIAEALEINEKTVSTYKTRLLKKLEAKSLADLINHARMVQIQSLQHAV